MLPISLVLAAALTMASFAPRPSSAQSTVIAGNPSANTPQTFNQPTIPWSQWQPKPTYAYEGLPDQYMGPDRGAPVGGAGGFQWDQYGHNRCLQGDGAWHSNSTCQTGWINDVNDWCIWGPHVPGVEVGAFEREALAYCVSDTHGTRLIPDGTLTGVHFVKTADYVQVTGIGNFTSIGIPQGDQGGEMDPHGADDLGNPIGGVMYTTAHPDHAGSPYQLLEWTNFQSYDRFCIRGCWGAQAALQCQHIYDVLGCAWNLPASYDAGFESCDGDVAPLQGIYGDYTFRQGDATTPPPHPAPSSSNCRVLETVSNGVGFGVADARQTGELDEFSAAATMSSNSNSASTSATSSAASAATSASADSDTSTVASTSTPGTASTSSINALSTSTGAQAAATGANRSGNSSGGSGSSNDAAAGGITTPASALAAAVVVAVIAGALI